jgi:SAM-dependent methyltransferase
MKFEILGGGNMGNKKKTTNIDNEVVQHFGKEWAKFNYSDGTADTALDLQFKAYTEPINISEFDNANAIAADFGAGSGRWAERLKPYFKKIYALEPSIEAVGVLNSKFKNDPQIEILNESVERNSIPASSLDFAMSLGVLHHIPDTQKALNDVSSKIKSGGLFLCYLYYKIEDKPLQYRVIFSLVNLMRNIVSRLPHLIRMIIAKFIALIIYLPLARLARTRKKDGKDVSNIPLHHYADMPFVMLENDALDRFGTRLEQRFNKQEITSMLEVAEFELSTLKFSSIEPFCTFSIKKK